MLQALRLKPVQIDPQGYIPSVAEPLFAAAKNGEDLVPVLTTITRLFGFDTFTCGVSMSIRPTEDSLIHVVTTLPPEWLELYDAKSFIEVDPRIQTLLATGLPIVIWDQQTFRGRNSRTDDFLDAASQFGLGSGVAVGFFDRRAHPFTVALNSAATIIDSQRRAEICKNIGDIVLLAHFFEELFVATIIDQKLRPTCQGAPISARERQCLALAANGQTGDDIAHKLGITTRTVQFHFDSIRSKLGATSRQEAIAKAVQAGIVHASI